MEPSGVLAPSEWSEILPPLQTFGYLAALTASALLLLAAVLTVYLAAGVRVKAWSLRVNSFVTLLFISALASPSTNPEGELLISEVWLLYKSSERRMRYVHQLRLIRH